MIWKMKKKAEIGRNFYVFSNQGTFAIKMK